jgi:hypothetical protein
MTASVSFLATLVYLALTITLLAPLVLLGLWIRDWIRKEIW